MTQNSPAEPDSPSGRGLSRSAIERATGGFSRRLGGSATIQAASRFLRRQLWAWPIIAALLLGGIGCWVSGSVEQAMRERRIDELQTILNADTEALRIWIAEQSKGENLLAAIMLSPARSRQRGACRQPRQGR
jgi:hypothetical protein